MTKLLLKMFVIRYRV